MCHLPFLNQCRDKTNQPTDAFGKPIYWPLFVTGGGKRHLFYVATVELPPFIAITGIDYNKN